MPAFLMRLPAAGSHQMGPGDIMLQALSGGIANSNHSDCVWDSVTQLTLAFSEAGWQPDSLPNCVANSVPVS